MKSNFYHFKNKAIKLRKSGKTYGEIKRILNISISKSTLSYWFKNINLTLKQKQIIQKRIKNNIERAQKLSLIKNKIKRNLYLNSIDDRIFHLKKFIENKDISKIALAMLYLAEGRKKNTGSLMFGNSNQDIINLFFYLLRYCYNIDEKKFRCTVQCRADQDMQRLEKYWSKITKVSLKQFYKSRIDPRTIGKPSKKLDYKGVCRVDYFSSDIDIELKKIAKIIYEGL
ncbi:MAG: hypothetical protein Q8N28_01290 [bacterium]|nr:hypothetical protein [bacterium]